MPCTSYDRDEENEKLRKEYEDKLTRMLCNICTNIEGERQLHYLLNDEEREWFEEHKKWDKRRIAMEKELKDREVKAKNANKTT